jgi:hypothetical protein
MGLGGRAVLAVVSGVLGGAGLVVFSAARRAERARPRAVDVGVSVTNEGLNVAALAPF